MHKSWPCAVILLASEFDGSCNCRLNDNAPLYLGNLMFSPTHRNTLPSSVCPARAMQPLGEAPSEQQITNGQAE